MASAPPIDVSRMDAPARSEEPTIKENSRVIVYTAAAVVGAIALAGFIISGGILPNANVGQMIPAGTEPGAVHGYVGGPGCLPAVGATVPAV